MEDQGGHRSVQSVRCSFLVGGDRRGGYLDLNDPPGWRFSSFRNILLYTRNESWSDSLFLNPDEKR